MDPEIYFLKIATVPEDLEDVLNLMDDICIFGLTQEEHNERLHKVLQYLKEAGVTLNPDKCIFSATSLLYPKKVVSRAIFSHHLQLN